MCPIEWNHSHVREIRDVNIAFTELARLLKLYDPNDDIDPFEFTVGETPVYGGTPGSVLYVGSDGTVSQNNSNFFFKDGPTAYGLQVGPSTLIGTLISSIGVGYLGAAGPGSVFYTEEQDPGPALGGTIAMGVSHTPTAGTPIAQLLLYGFGGGGLSVSGNILNVSEDDWNVNPGRASLVFTTGDSGAGMILKNNGRLAVFDTLEAHGFFLTDDTKFYVGGQVTSIGTSVTPFDLIKIMAESTADIEPSGDTNSGFGASIYTAQGFNLNAYGSQNYNGGLILGNQSAYSFSLIGAFGQANYRASGGTLDAGVGVLCTASHGGYGGAATAVIGGLFDGGTIDDTGSGSPIGTLNIAMGGMFTAGINEGISITSAASLRSNEPIVVSSSGKDITNRTAAWIDGTISVTDTDVPSAASLTAVTVGSSLLEISGSTAWTLHGLKADAFNKLVDIVNTSTQKGIVKHESGTEATGVNRIITPQGSEFEVPPGASFRVYYCTTSNRWRVLTNPTWGSTWTPTLTNVANLASSTAYLCNYVRIGNFCVVSGRFDADPTTTALSCQLGISLPIPSNFAAISKAEACGVVFASSIAGQGAAIFADVTNDRLQAEWIAGDVTNQQMYFIAMYRLL